MYYNMATFYIHLWHSVTIYWTTGCALHSFIDYNMHSTPWRSAVSQGQDSFHGLYHCPSCIYSFFVFLFLFLFFLFSFLLALLDLFRGRMWLKILLWVNVLCLTFFLEKINQWFFLDFPHLWSLLLDCKVSHSTVSDDFYWLMIKGTLSTQKKLSMNLS